MPWYASDTTPMAIRMTAMISSPLFMRCLSGAPGLCSARGSYRPAALDDPDEDHRERNQQQKMDEPTERVRTHHPDRPQHQQDHEYRPEHVHGLLSVESLADTRHTTCQRRARRASARNSSGRRARVGSSGHGDRPGARQLYREEPTRPRTPPLEKCRWHRPCDFLRDIPYDRPRRTP